MNLKDYFDDLHKAETALERDHPEGIVFVTSLFHRERNSTPGCTMSASCRNAARVITDGTHREATQEEIKAFFARQDSELRKNVQNEQRNKRQYIVVVDQKADAEAAMASAGQQPPASMPPPLAPPAPRAAKGA
jgi:hypothetical protein